MVGHTFSGTGRSYSPSIDDVLIMKTHHPFIRVLLMSILAGLLVASAGMASAGRLGFFQTAAEKSPVRHESTTCAPDDEGTSDDQGTTEEEGSDDQGSQDEGTSEDEGSKDEGSSEECEDPEGDETTKPDEGDEATQPGDPADREAECNEAAGVSPAPEGEGGSEATQEDAKTTGLDHAIEVVLANCIKNPQAPGLVNALRHLVANRDRHLAHQAELAARRAAREAAKAAGHGAHGLGHGKGPK